VRETLATIQSRWKQLGLVLMLTWAVVLSEQFAPTWSHSHRDISPVWLGITINLAFQCLWSFRDSLLTAIALQARRGISLSMAAVASLVTFPALVPYRVVGIAPAEITWLWRQWSAPLPIGQLASFEMLTSLVFGLWALMIAAAWGLTPPVAIAERTDAIVSLDRSWTLLRTKRWLLVGLLVALAVIEGLPALITPLAIFKIEGDVSVDQMRSFFRVERTAETVFSEAVHLVILVMIAAFYKVASGTDSGETEAAEVFA
jgi:hypothetical protein